MQTSILLAAQAARGGGDWTFLIMMVAIFAIMWLFMIRPQQKKQKEIRNFQNSLQEGAKVVTGGGIYGTVRRINLETRSVDVDERGRRTQRNAQKSQGLFLQCRE